MLHERATAIRKAIQVTLEEAAKVVEQHNTDLMTRWNEVTKEPPVEAKIRALDPEEIEKRVEKSF